MKSAYTISEAARLFDISTQTLRHYDKIGLLKPSMKNKENNYRVYGATEIQSLYLIIELKSMGLSLDEIKEYCSTKNIDKLESILQKNNNTLSQKIDELLITKTRTAEYLRKIEFARRNYDDSCEIREIHERQAYLINIDFMICDLEHYINTLNASYSVSGPHPENPSRGRVLIMMSKKNLEQKKFKIYSGVGFFLTKPINYTHYKIIPAGKYAVTYHAGAYDNIHQSYSRLYYEIEQRGLHITGDAIEVSITDIAFTRDKNNFITEIQIPVSD